MEGTSTIAVWEAYVYDGWNMVLSVKLNPEVGASQGRPQSAIASYVWRPDLGSTPFARRNWQAAGGVRGLVMANYFTGANGGGIHLPVMDAMGNVTQVVRAGVQLNYNGDSMRSEFVYDYDAFGKETRSSTLVAGLNPDSFPFHYSTKFTDPESGFNYYGYRFYDPANGRWPNRDPIGETGGNNLYGMLGNDAVNLVDVLGLWGTKAHQAIIDQVVKDFGLEGLLKGCGIDVAQSLKNASNALDGLNEEGSPFPRLDKFFREQSEKRNPYHAMRREGQTVEDAKNEYVKVMEKMKQMATDALKKAKGAQKQCDKCAALQEALDAIGGALHALTDSYSPAHRGFQEWPGPVDAALNGEAARHGDGSHSHENLDTLNHKDGKFTPSNLHEMHQGIQRTLGPLLNQLNPLIAR